MFKYSKSKNSTYNDIVSGKIFGKNCEVNDMSIINCESVKVQFSYSVSVSNVMILLYAILKL